MLSMTGFLFQLIAHQALFANGHSLGALHRRRIIRAHREGSPQLDVDSVQQLLVGRLFVASGVVCAHDERKDDVEAQRSLNLPAYGRITERVCTSSGPPNRILTFPQPVSGDFEARKVLRRPRRVGPLGTLRGKQVITSFFFFLSYRNEWYLRITQIYGE